MLAKQWKQNARIVDELEQLQQKKISFAIKKEGEFITIVTADNMACRFVSVQYIMTLKYPCGHFDIQLRFSGSDLRKVALESYLPVIKIHQIHQKIKKFFQEDESRAKSQGEITINLGRGQNNRLFQVNKIRVPSKITLFSDAVQLAYDDKQPEKIPRVKAQAGIINIGNSCFMNAVIQMLFSCELFRHSIIEMQHKNRRMEALSEIFQYLQKQNTLAYTDETNLRRVQGDFRNFSHSQQDSYEYYLDLLKQLSSYGQYPLSLFQMKQELSLYKQCNCPAKRLQQTQLALEVYPAAPYKQVKQFIQRNSSGRCSCRKPMKTTNKIVSASLYFVVHLNWTQSYDIKQNGSLVINGQKYVVLGKVKHLGHSTSGHYFYRDSKRDYNDRMVGPRGRGGRTILLLYVRQNYPHVGILKEQKTKVEETTKEGREQQKKQQNGGYITLDVVKKYEKVVQPDVMQFTLGRIDKQQQKLVETGKITQHIAENPKGDTQKDNKELREFIGQLVKQVIQIATRKQNSETNPYSNNEVQALDTTTTEQAINNIETYSNKANSQYQAPGNVPDTTGKETDKIVKAKERKQFSFVRKLSDTVREKQQLLNAKLLTKLNAK